MLFYKVWFDKILKSLHLSFKTRWITFGVCQQAFTKFHNHPIRILSYFPSKYFKIVNKDWYQNFVGTDTNDVQPVVYEDTHFCV